MTLEGPHGIGVLQISSYAKDGSVSEQDLADFAEDHLSAGARPVRVMFGPYTGFRIAFSVDESFWQQWYLRQGGQMLFISYTCPIESRTAEHQDIDQILSSLAPRGGA